MPFGYNHISLPYNPLTFSIDTANTLSVIHEEQPQLVILGGSVVLFAEPVAEIANVVHNYGGTVLYDAAHIVGHILGGHFPNSLVEDCDLMTFTLCKTVAGPQHAIICGGQEHIEKIQKTSRFWYFGYHLHEVAAATLSLIRHLEAEPNYSAQMLANARALADGLKNRGASVCTNSDGVASQTYMFLADVSRYGGGRSVEELLVKTGMLVSRNLLSSVSGQRPSDQPGLRFGVAEVTSCGMTEPNMDKLADVISEVISSKSALENCEALKELAYGFPLSCVL